MGDPSYGAAGDRGGIKAWGYEFKSGTVWAKDRAGTGYWFRNQAELLLVGTRGDVPVRPRRASNGRV